MDEKAGYGGYQWLEEQKVPEHTKAAIMSMIWVPGIRIFSRDGLYGL